MRFQLAGYQGSVVPQHRQVMSAPIVVPLEDTNGDGKIDRRDVPAVVFHAFVSGAFSGKDGHELWTVSEAAYRTNGTGSIAAADLDGDGFVEIVVPKDGGGLLAFSHAGTLKRFAVRVGNNRAAMPLSAQHDAMALAVETGKD